MPKDAGPLREIEEQLFAQDGAPLDLLRKNFHGNAALTTLGIFLKGRLVERVIQGSCGWGQLLEVCIVHVCMFCGGCAC